MEYTSVQHSAGRFLRLVALYCIFLACGPTSSVGQDTEAQFHVEVPALECSSTSSSSWLVNILMAIALTYALLEYSQLALLLIGDREAAQACFQQHRPAKHFLNHMRGRGEMKQTSARTPERPETKQGMNSDRISTNIVSTPSQVLDDSEVDASRMIRHAHTHTDKQLRDPPICSCEQEEYLVALEDDVRRPCAASTELETNAQSRLTEQKPHAATPSHVAQSEPSSTKIATPTQSSERNEASDAHTAGDTAHEFREVHPAFQNDLLPAAEETPMDAL